MTRGAGAALAGVVLVLAGCGEARKATPTEPNRERARESGLTGTVRVRSVRCARHGDRIHYVCRIRTSSRYSKARVDTNVADAFYNPRTDQADYNIRP
jgi:hypothetical protein